MIAYIPATVMWIPSFFSKKAMGLYVKAQNFGVKRTGPLLLLKTITFLVIDQILTTSGDPRNKDVWMMGLLYPEFEMLLSWSIPHYKLDQAAMLVYFWDFIQTSKQQFDDAVAMNDGTGDEIPEGVNELLAVF